ncbi:MAG: hypothetical protein M1827_004880 [Pycnora praestabilis]|nr:MAG: hypothetical protein M1827_004880 [Pycnora praestabilis]
MPASSLYLLAKRACVKNIKSITDVGDIPYELIRPVLVKVQNPDQLIEIEKSSPQICGADADIWMGFIKRDIPQWETRPHQPKNTKNWHKVYRKLRKELEVEVERDAQALMHSLTDIDAKSAKHTSRIIDASSVPRLPRDRGMRTTHPKQPSNPALLSFTSGSKTKLRSGKDVLNKARREAREMSLFSAKKSILATPTHRLNSGASQVQAAPRGLVEGHRKPPPPVFGPTDVKPATVFAPRRSSSMVHTTQSVRENTDVERERRLKAFTNPSSSVGTERDRSGNPISSSSAPSTTTNRSQTTPTFSVSLINSEAYPPNLKSSDIKSATSDNVSQLLHPMAYSGSAYKAPRLKPAASSPERQGGTRGGPEKKKVEVDPFMRVKRRKV